MAQSRRDFLRSDHLRGLERGRGAGQHPPARAHEPLREADDGVGLPRAGLHLPGRRQRLEQHDRPDATRRTTTSTSRRGRSRRGSGWTPPTLLPIGTPPSFNGTGRTFGLHPSLPELQSLYLQNKLAVVCNVGPLVEPLTQQDYVNGTKPTPYSLFSHSDQIDCWQTSQAVAAHRDRLGRAHRRRHDRLQQRPRASRRSRRSRAPPRFCVGIADDAARDRHRSAQRGPGPQRLLRLARGRRAQERHGLRADDRPRRGPDRGGERRDPAGGRHQRGPGHGPHDQHGLPRLRSSGSSCCRWPRSSS